jgi:hypothetical protein
MYERAGNKKIREFDAKKLHLDAPLEKLQRKHVPMYCWELDRE